MNVRDSGLGDVKNMPAGVLPTVKLLVQAEAGIISDLKKKDFELVDGVKLRREYQQELEEMKAIEKNVNSAAKAEPVNDPKDSKDDKHRKMDKAEVKDFLNSEKKEKKEHSRKKNSGEITTGRTKDTAVKKGGGA